MTHISGIDSLPEFLTQLLIYANKDVSGTIYGVGVYTGPLTDDMLLLLSACASKRVGKHNPIICAAMKELGIGAFVDLQITLCSQTTRRLPSLRRGAVCEKKVALVRSLTIVAHVNR